MPNPERNDKESEAIKIQGLDPETSERLQDSIREFHSEHPELDLSEVANFAAKILGHNQESSDPDTTDKLDPERQKAIETLLNPKIYNELDYWDGRHGVKFRTGTIPEGTFSDTPPSTVWFKTMTDPPVDLRQSHHGKGATTVLRGEHNTVYVLHYQVNTDNDRPDVYSVTRVPNTDEFKSLRQQLDADGSILLDAFPTLYPNVPESRQPQEIKLKNKAPIELGFGDIKVQFRIYPNSLRNL